MCLLWLTPLLLLQKVKRIYNLLLMVCEMSIDGQLRGDLQIMTTRKLFALTLLALNLHYSCRCDIFESLVVSQGLEGVKVLYKLVRSETFIFMKLYS